MTNNPADRAPLTFSEVVLTGAAGPVRAFLTQLCADRGKCLTCWFQEDAAIDDGEGALAKAAEKLRLRAPDVNLVASDDLVALLREHADDAAAKGVGKLVSVTPNPRCLFRDQIPRVLRGARPADPGPPARPAAEPPPRARAT